MGNYLVTGAAGFIASRVIAILLDRGDTVSGLDNLNDAYDVRLKEWRLKDLQSREGFRFERLDLGDREGLARLFAEQGPFDGVINLAARAGVRQSVENPWVYIDTNTTGTLNLLELCKDHGVGKFVLASTSSLYGTHNPIPYSEDADTNKPISPYAASKKAAEALCHTYHYLFGIDVTVFRYFTVYGPAGRPDMSLFRFVQWVSEDRPVLIYGDGQQSRDFTFVDDIARGTVAGLKPLGYEVINLGSDEPVVLRDALSLVEKLVGKEAQIDFRPMHRADVQRTWADISKARELLGWSPRTLHEEGIRKTVEWYNANREWARELSTH
ncbi:MAG: NAD-dependent epimerase/dehydratase family protein [Acidobacteria bacterium]|nr:NAD-dependent epimerase/dehydratase family protein [Acidobacteriota bacterium]